MRLRPSVLFPATGLTAILLALVLAPVGAGDDTAAGVPHWRFPEGQALKYDLSRIVAGKSTTGDVHLTLKVSLTETPGASTEGEPAHVKCCFDQISIEGQQGTRHMSYDSRKKSPPPAKDVLLQCFAALVEKTVDARITSQGDVTAIDGMEALLGNTGAGPEGQEVMAQIKGLLLFQCRCVPVSDSAKQPWEAHFQFPLGQIIPGQQEIVEKVTFQQDKKGSEKGFPTQSFSSKSEFLVPDIGNLLPTGGGNPGGGAGAAGGDGAVGMGGGGNRPKAQAAPKITQSGTGKASFADAGFLVKSQRKTTFAASQGKVAVSWSVEYTAELTNKPDTETPPKK